MPHALGHYPSAASADDIDVFAQTGGHGYQLLRKRLTVGVGGNPYTTMYLFDVTGAVLVKIMARCVVGEPPDNPFTQGAYITPFYDDEMDLENFGSGLWASADMQGWTSDVYALQPRDWAIASDINWVEAMATPMVSFTIDFFLFWTPLSADGLVTVATGGEGDWPA